MSKQTYFEHKTESLSPGLSVAQKFNQPPWERLKPTTLSQVVGQSAVSDEGGIIRTSIRRCKQDPTEPLLSLLIYGPSGCGKSCFARIYASELPNYKTIEVTSLKGISQAAQQAVVLQSSGKRLLLIIDDINRFGFKKQDALIPLMDNNNISVVCTMVGSPLHSVSPGVRSRCKVVEFEALSEEALMRIGLIVMRKLKGNIGSERMTDMCIGAGGDCRKLIQDIALEINVNKDGVPGDSPKQIDYIHVPSDSSSAKYNYMSSLIKSIRGSDVDASLLYLNLLLEHKEDPQYISRRLAISSCEDVGIAEPNAVVVVENCCKLVDRFVESGNDAGIKAALNNCTVFLANCPKSSAVYNVVGNIAALIDRIGLGSKQLDPPNEFLPSANLKSEQREKYVHPMAHGNQMRHNYMPPALRNLKLYREDYIPPPKRYDEP